MSFAAISSHCIRMAYNVFASLFVIGALAVSVCGQSSIDASTPPGLSPGAPAGSFALSGFDNVNLFNGNLNVSLPVINGVKMELKTLGTAASANTLKNSISSAVGQGGGNVLIDARGAAQITVADAQRAAARVFGADSRLQVVRIVGNDFDVTIARQAN